MFSDERAASAIGSYHRPVANSSMNSRTLSNGLPSSSLTISVRSAFRLPIHIREQQRNPKHYRSAGVRQNCGGCRCSGQMHRYLMMIFNTGGPGTVDFPALEEVVREVHNMTVAASPSTAGEDAHGLIDDVMSPLLEIANRAVSPGKNPSPLPLEAHSIRCIVCFPSAPQMGRQTWMPFLFPHASAYFLSSVLIWKRYRDRTSTSKARRQRASQLARSVSRRRTAEKATSIPTGNKPWIVAEANWGISLFPRPPLSP